MTQDQYLTNLKGLRSQIDSAILEIESDDHLTNQEACRILNVCAATLSRYARVYPLKNKKKHGHSCYIKAEIIKLKAALDAGKIKFEIEKINNKQLTSM